MVSQRYLHEVIFRGVFSIHEIDKLLHISLNLDEVGRQVIRLGYSDTSAAVSTGRFVTFTHQVVYGHSMQLSNRLRGQQSAWRHDLLDVVHRFFNIANLPQLVRVLGLTFYLAVYVVR